MKELEQFIDMIHSEQFIEAHVILEHPWKEYKKIEDKKEEAKILKGLINGTTAIALFQKGKQAYKQVWSTFIKYEPLIDNVESVYTAKYKTASEVLHEKYKNICGL